MRLEDFIQATSPIRERPFRLLCLHPDLAGRRPLRCSLMLTNAIQATPIGGRCRAYVMMSSHPSMYRFVGKGIDVVIKNFDQMIVAIFDYLHVLMINEPVADPTGTYVTLEPSVPVDVIARVSGEEIFWKKKYEELEAKYRQDMERVTEEYFKALDGMRRIIVKYAEQVPALADLANWFLSVKDVAFNAEALSRLVASASAVGLSEEASPPESPARRRGVLRRLVEFLGGR